MVRTADSDKSLSNEIIAQRTTKQHSAAQSVAYSSTRVWNPFSYLVQHSGGRGECRVVEAAAQ